MSLELSITALTAAITALVAALPTAQAPAPTTDAAEPAKRGPGRPKKNETVTAAANDALGNPAGTTYWFNEKHNSVYRIVPGDGTPGPMEGSVELTAEQFATAQAALAERFTDPSKAAQPQVAAASSQPTAVTVTTAAPSVAPSQVTVVADYAAVRTALLKITADDPVNGRTRVMAILKDNGINAVPELATKPVEVLAKVLSACTADDLFGA